MEAKLDELNKKVGYNKNQEPRVITGEQAIKEWEEKNGKSKS